MTDTWYVYRALTDIVSSNDSSTKGGQHPPKAANVDGLRLTRSRGCKLCDLLDFEVRSTFEAAIERLRKAGAGIARSEYRACPLHWSNLPGNPAHGRRGLSRNDLGSCARDDTTAVRLRLEMGRYVMGKTTRGRLLVARCCAAG